MRRSGVITWLIPQHCLTPGCTKGMRHGLVCRNTGSRSQNAHGGCMGVAGISSCTRIAPHGHTQSWHISKNPQDVLMTTPNSIHAHLWRRNERFAYHRQHHSIQPPLGCKSTTWGVCLSPPSPTKHTQPPVASSSSTFSSTHHPPNKHPYPPVA
jgi:hypothetical protein